MDELLNIDEETRKALHIASVSESDITIRGLYTEINMNKYEDGDITIDFDEGEDKVTYTFSKTQIEFIAKWFSHSR